MDTQSQPQPQSGAWQPDNAGMPHGTPVPQPSQHFQQPQQWYAGPQAQPPEGWSPGQMCQPQPQPQSVCPTQPQPGCQPPYQQIYQPQQPPCQQPSVPQAQPFQQATYQQAPVSCPAYQPPYQQQMPATTAVASRKPKSGWGKLIGGLLLGVVAYLGGAIVGLLVAGVTGANYLLTVEVSCAVCAALCCLMLGGRQLLAWDRVAFKECFSKLWWMFIPVLFFMQLLLIAYIAEGDALDQNWPLNVLFLLVFTAAVGIFEEALFRGLLLHGLLARMGVNRRGVVGALVISSLLFGVAHISFGGVDFSDGLQVVQAILKICQAGLLGFVFAAFSTKQNRICAIAFIHALTDFLIMVVPDALMGPMVEASYVSNGSDGSAIIVMYLVYIALYLPAAVIAWRSLKESLPSLRGAFYRA